MRTSIQPRPALIRGLRRYILVARTTYPGTNNGQPRVTVSVVGDWREGYTTKAEALRDARPLRQMVREGATNHELCTVPGGISEPKEQSS